MEALNIQLSPFFQWLLKTSLQGSLLICLILLVKTVLRGKLPIRWHYYLWLLLLVRLALPWAPQSRFSMYSLIPQYSSPESSETVLMTESMAVAESHTTADSETTKDTAEHKVVEQQTVQPESTTPESRLASISAPVAPETVSSDRNDYKRSVFTGIVRILPLVWFLGAIALGGYVAVRNFKLWGAIKRERPITDSEILELLEDCKMQMNVRTIVGVIVTDRVKSPALFGFIRPRFLLPQGLIEALDFEELRYVFLHELAHLKRRDIYLSWLVSLLQVLHWFNPLIWFALRRMRTDQELACDGLVLSTMETDEPPKYGRTIVNLFERFSQVSYVPSLAGILEDTSQLERRIKMIAKFKNDSRRSSPFAVILIIILACVSLPDALGDKGLVSSSAGHAPETVMRRVILKRLQWPISPPSLDGRCICGIDWSTGNLAVHELTTGNEREVTNKNGAWDDSADFAFWSLISPDSTKVTYLWCNDDKDENFNFELRLTDFNGSEPQVLCQFEKKDMYAFLPIGWSSDNTEILGAFSRKGEPTQIVWVSTADGSMRTATTLGQEVSLLGPESFRGDRTAKFNLSPDGRYLAYEAPQQKGSPKFDIFVSALDRKHEICLVSHTANDMLMGWTPDGRHIVFASDRTGTRDAWSLRVVDGKPEGLPERVKSQIGNIDPLGFAPDGSYYYGLTDETWNVYIVKLDPETGKVLSPPRAVRHTGLEGSPDWSPDGRYLAYCSRKETDKSQAIHLQNLATGQERTLVEKLPYFIWLRWSPDGQSILITGFEEETPHVVYKLDVQTGKRTTLLSSDEMHIRGAELSSDVKTLFYLGYESTSKTKHLMARNLETGQEKELLQIRSSGTPVLRRWALSPDGQQLVLSTRLKLTDWPWALRIISAKGGESKKLVGGEIGEVAWTADGQNLLFTKPDEKLWRISAEGGEPQELWEWKEGFRDLRVNPDGQHIAFATRGYMYELWVMENFLLEEPVAKPEPIPTLRQVWAGPDVDPHVAVSPDGRYLSYVDWKTGDLCIREIATGKMRPLTSKGNLETARLFALYSVISPDSRLIAYSWSNEHGTLSLCLVGIDGSADRTLYASENHVVFPVCWSSDSKQVVAKRYNNENLEIISVSVEQDSIKVLKKFDKPPLWDNFCYSSSDRFIVYDFPSEDKPTNYDIGLFDTKDNVETLLIEHPANDILLGCFPNREEILFLSDRAGSQDIWAVKLVDGEMQGSPRPVIRDIGQLYPHGLTQDSSFYFSRYTRRFTTNIVSFDAQTGEIHEQSNKPLLGSNSYPVWSPDGESIAYVTEKGDNRRLHIRSLSTGEERELASDIEVRNPRWSPDGRFILVPGFDQNLIKRETYRGGIYKIDVQNGQATQLLGFSPDRQVGWARSTAEWSLDGKAIFYLAPNGIVRRELESGQEKQLYQSANLRRALDVSPDGKTLVFCEGTPDERTFRIIVVPVSGGEPRELCKFEEPKGEIQVPRSVVWTADGNYVLFAKDEAKGSAIWRIAFQGGDPQMIMESSNDVHSLGIHPNGKEIAYCTYLQEGAIWVMENFLPKAVVSAEK
jgi:Tol biopolymer transport system component/beta-lactamase regulating signal transducer with metallopeptidase domain